MSERLVGREEELASIQSWLDAVPDGPSGLLIEGEAGIGKTALFRSAINAGRSREWQVLVAQPTEVEQKLSFSGLTDLLEPVVESVLPALPAPQQEALEVALLWRTSTDRPPNPRTIGAATLSSFRILSAQGPVLVAVDDIQWLDEATSAALSFALRRLVSERVGVLVARRAAPGKLGPPLGLEATLGRLTVGPLDELPLRELLEIHLHRVPSRAVLRRIVEVSGGNPLFAVELCLALGTSEELDPGEPLPLPEQLRDLVLSRVRRLPERHRSVLLHAAALRAPTLSLLRETIADATLVEQAIDAATEAGFLVGQGQRLAFAHPLYASVLYGSTRASARRAAHARLAEVVTDREEAARHRALAAIGPDVATAFELEKAAAIARARGAAGAAAELAELAHRLTPPGKTEDALRRTLLAARYHIDAQDLPAAQRLLESLVKSDAATEIRAEGLLLLARIEVRRRPEEAIARAQEGLAILGDQHEGLRAKLLTQLSSVLTNVGARHIREAVDAASQAMRLARSAGDKTTEAQALMFHLMTSLMGGHTLDHAKLDLIPSIDSGAPRLYFAGLVLMAMGHHDRARSWLEQLHERQALLGDDFDHPLTIMMLAELEAREGRLHHSRELAETSLGLLRLQGQTAVAPFAASVLSSVMASSGDISSARALVDEWRPVAELGPTPAGLAFIGRADGFVHLCADDPGAAVTALAPVWELMEEIGVVEHAVYPFRTDFIEALIRTEQLGRAEEILRIVEARRSSYETFARHCWLRSRALLAAARGDLQASIEAGERALTLAEELPMRFEAARTMLVLGGVLRRAKQKRAARHLLGRALGDFRTCRATLWANKAAGELDRLGTAPSSSLELTPTERRVADLVALGKTNREIAAELSISVKTVESNLARIYRKVGVKRRAELVRVMIGMKTA